MVSVVVTEDEYGLRQIAIITTAACCLSLALSVVFICACCYGKSEREKSLKKMSQISTSTSDPKKRVDSVRESGPKVASPQAPLSSPPKVNPIFQCEQSAITFSLAWFRAAASVNDEQRSTFVSSPFAVQTAFALWYFGMNDDYKERTMKTLFPGCVNNDQVIIMLRTMTNSTKWWCRKSIHLANRLCAPANFRYSVLYRRQVSSLFGGNQFLPVDFVANAPVLVDSTNRWTASITKGRAQLIESLDSHKHSGLLLVSAIFVDAKSHLKNPFNRFYTHYGEPFYYGARRSIRCDYMWQKKEMGYCEDELCRVIRLPYKGDTEMGLYVFLPHKRLGLNELEAKLSADYLLDRLNTCYSTSKTVEVFLPKMALDSLFKKDQMKYALHQLGLATMEIFDKAKQVNTSGEGAFSKMISSVQSEDDGPVRMGRNHKRKQLPRSVWMAQMVHKTSFELGDSAPEEADLASVTISNVDSVTVNTSSGKSGGSGNDRKAMPGSPFKADHPFLFLLVVDIPKIPIVVGRFCG